MYSGGPGLQLGDTGFYLVWGSGGGLYMFYAGRNDSVYFWFVDRAGFTSFR